MTSMNMIITVSCKLEDDVRWDGDIICGHNKVAALEVAIIIKLSGAIFSIFLK